MTGKNQEAKNFNWSLASEEGAMASGRKAIWNSPHHEYDMSSSSRAIVDEHGVVVAFAVVSYDEWHDPVKEVQLKENAALIAEAGTAQNISGLSPLELLSFLQAIIDAADSEAASGGEVWFSEAVSGPIEAARVVLKKNAEAQ